MKASNGNPLGKWLRNLNSEARSGLIGAEKSLQPAGSAALTSNYGFSVLTGTISSTEAFSVFGLGKCENEKWDAWKILKAREGGGDRVGNFGGGIFYDFFIRKKLIFLGASFVVGRNTAVVVLMGNVSKNFMLIFIFFKRKMKFQRKTYHFFCIKTYFNISRKISHQS